MVPSGDIVDADEKEQRLKARGLRRNTGTTEEYRGFEIEKVEGVFISTGSADPRIFRDIRGKKYQRSGPGHKATQYLIHYPDGGSKTVSTMKAAREYIDNYLGDA